MSAPLDLTYPTLPDARDMDRSARPDAGDFEWPEAGPSEPSKRKPKLGPSGAKVVAAMTGAMTTSLLSVFISSPIFQAVLARRFC